MSLLPPDHVPLPAGQAPAMDPRRLAGAMKRWRRRSRVIYFWRRALPALMILIAASVLTLVVHSLLTSHGPSAQDQEIRMLSPRFLGQDKSGRPYTITAKEAVRDAVHTERISLDQPHMVLQGQNGDGPTTVDSATGLYNENTHILALDGQVHFNDGKGDVFVSEHALVDTDAGSVDGRSPVVGTGPLGQTSASAYSVKGKGSDVVFSGNVKTHIVNK